MLNTAMKIGQSPRRFIFDSTLALYIPLCHPEKVASPFTSGDLNAHVCTVTGTTWGIQGRTFNGTSDKIVIAALAALCFGGTAMTIEMWLKITDTVALTNLIAAQRDMVSVDNWQFDIPTDALRFVAWPGPVIATCPTNVTYAAWAQYGLVFNGTTAQFFKNGAVLGAAQACAVTIASNVIETDIGRAYTDFYKGQVGEVRIYSRALNILEIQHNYNGTRWRYGV